MLYGLNKIIPLILARKQQSLSILIYHQVLKEFDYMRPDEPTASEFNWQMQLLNRYFTPLKLSDALVMLERNTLPNNAVCVTFDDGYADNFHIALPILKNWNIPATVFIATGFLNGGRMWNDTIIESVRYADTQSWDLQEIGLAEVDLSSYESRRLATNSIINHVKHMNSNDREQATNFIAKLSSELPTDLMMSNDQVRALSRNGVEIGAHTVSHPILTKITEIEAREEILESRSYLEKLLDKDIVFFAYPNGRFGSDFNDTHVELVEELGFRGAVATDWGVSTIRSNRFKLARFTPWDRNPIKFYTRLILNGQ